MTVPENTSSVEVPFENYDLLETPDIAKTLESLDDIRRFEEVVVLERNFDR